MGAAKERYIAPDYTDATESDISDLDSIATEDEGRIETFLDSQRKLNEQQLMQTTPFGDSPVTSTQQTTSVASSWGSTPSTPWNSGNTSWGNNNSWGGNNTPTSPWQQQQTPSSPWGNNTNNNTDIANKAKFDRNKRVIFINFFDGVVETWDSKGNPGLCPRGAYDLIPRFDAWRRLRLMNPEWIYVLAPKGFHMSTIQHFCIALSDFLGRPQGSCKPVFLNIHMKYPKLDAIKFFTNKYPKEDIIFVGNHSGLPNQGNEDIVSAEKCGISYVDLNTLINNLV